MSNNNKTAKTIQEKWRDQGLCASGCGDNIRKNKSVLKCSICNNVYCYTCINSMKKKFTELTKTEKNSWLCPECQGSMRRGGDNSSTPVRSKTPRTNDVNTDLQSSPLEHSFVPELSANCDSPKQLNANAIAELKKMLREELYSELLEEIKGCFLQEMRPVIRQMIQTEISPIKNTILELEKSISLLSAEYDEMKPSLTSITAGIRDAKSKCKTVDDDVNELKEKFEKVEYYQRESNVEIHGLPEHRNEILLNTMQQLARVVDCPLEKDDVQYCSRVKKIDTTDKKPRTVIMKLKDVRSRDALLAAVGKYNKNNSKNKLSSSLLGMGGVREPVYVSEHMSPTMKSLHAATRIAAKQNKYTFVWVRNGRIMARKSEKSPMIHIRNKQSLNLLI